MEENTIETTNKPTQGTYNDMTPSSERKPKIEFEINKPVEVMFKIDFVKPREYPSQDKGVYYLFECMSGGEDKVFLTAAWSLLQGLKNAEPLAGKTLKIQKVLKVGKQHYEVEDLNNPEVPVEKVGDDKIEELKVDE